MKKIIKLLIILLIVAITINIYIVLSTKKQIITIEDINLKDIDCILVLGASIRNNKPSPMLEDRLKTSMEIFNNKITDRILVSGDHTETNNYKALKLYRRIGFREDFCYPQAYLL